MFKKLIILFPVYFFCQSGCLAQKTGILPLTGMVYFNEGIWSKSVAVRISGEQVIGNRIPLNREIEVSLVQPTGFTPDKKKNVFIGAEYSLVSAKGEVLRNIPNLLFLHQTKGFTAKELKQLVLKFGIAEGVIQPNAKAVIRIRVFDMKGKSQLRLEYPVSIAYPREAIPLSKSVNTLKTPPGTLCMAAGLTAGTFLVSVDSLVTTDKKMDYIKLEISKIEGTDIIGMLEGRENFWVYDSAFTEIKIKEILLKKVGGAMEGGSVNSTLRIPFRLKTARAKSYFIRYRWESADKAQVLDIVVSR